MLQKWNLNLIQSIEYIYDWLSLKSHNLAFIFKGINIFVYRGLEDEGTAKFHDFRK